MKPILLTLVCILVAGCASSPAKESHCGYSLSAETHAQDGEAVSLSRTFLSQHPALSTLLSKPRQELLAGPGQPVACEEGETTMAALEEIGGNLTVYDSGSKETRISFEGQEYRLLMAYSVAG